MIAEPKVNHDGCAHDTSSERYLCQGLCKANAEIAVLKDALKTAADAIAASSGFLVNRRTGTAHAVMCRNQSALDHITNLLSKSKETNNE